MEFLTRGALALAVAAASCVPSPGPAAPRVLAEAFLSDPVAVEDIDSLAAWHGAGHSWILATAKVGSRLHVYEAGSGRLVRHFGEPGDGPGQFRRPNGIAVVDDLAFVVERDNRRIQVLRLPAFEPLGLFGSDRLRRPYGLTVLRDSQGAYSLYVTDNYETPAGTEPPASELGERVHHFRVQVGGGGWRATWVRAFGDTAGPGVLHKVETLQADASHGRLLVADELEKTLKVYTLEGRFTGEIVGRGLFRFEPEGVALWTCGGEGYWIVTDQDPVGNVFHVLDRRRFAPLGAFSGRTVRNTDGVALTQGGGGVFYAVHDDQSVAAIPWVAIARAFGLREACAAEGA